MKSRITSRVVYFPMKLFLSITIISINTIGRLSFNSTVFIATRPSGSYLLTRPSGSYLLTASLGILLAIKFFCEWLSIQNRSTNNGRFPNFQFVWSGRSHQSVFEWSTRVLRTGSGQYGPAHGSEPLSSPTPVGQSAGIRRVVAEINVCVRLGPFHLNWNSKFQFRAFRPASPDSSEKQPTSLKTENRFRLRRSRAGNNIALFGFA